jgi:hypothetical protein
MSTIRRLLSRVAQGARTLSRARRIAIASATGLFVAACVTTGTDSMQQHLWWAGLGPALPHDTFPGDCALCHVGGDWQTLTQDFQFDHERETGVPLNGAHSRAACLRCHNDRGPVESFSRLGCAGCHEDVHFGRLGTACTDCHQEQTWDPVGQIERHNRTRFPLVGVHAATACHRCHPGAETGYFTPVDVECVTCHQADLANATNPNHIGLGWTNRCDRCHLPRTWQHAEINN